MTNELTNKLSCFSKFPRTTFKYWLYFSAFANLNFKTMTKFQNWTECRSVVTERQKGLMPNSSEKLCFITLKWKLLRQLPNWNFSHPLISVEISPGGLFNKRWTSYQIWILWSQVITRINLDEFYRYLNDKSITATNTLSRWFRVESYTKLT